MVLEPTSSALVLSTWHEHELIVKNSGCISFFCERNKTQDKIKAKRNAHNLLLLTLATTTFNNFQLRSTQPSINLLNPRWWRWSSAYSSVSDGSAAATATDGSIPDLTTPANSPRSSSERHCHFAPFQQQQVSSFLNSAFRSWWT